MKHMKHMVLSIIITMLTFSLVACSTEHPSSSPDQQKEEPFTYIGVYTWDPVVDFYDFFKACGINTIQLSERSWFYDASAENFENFYQSYAKQISDVQDAGLYADLLLYSNIEQYQGPDAYNTVSGGVGDWFDPRDTTALQEKMTYIRKIMSACKHADFFTLEAGDPGGFISQLGEGTTEAFAILAKEYAQASRELAPDVQFHINTWALSAFGKEYPVSSDYRWWKQETEMTKELLTMQGLFGSDVGICFPCHDYYRPLSRKLWTSAIRFGKEEEMPVAYPQVEDVRVMRAAGVDDVWLWPYGLMDTDGDADYGATFTSNLRYIHRFLQDVRPFSAKGIMVDWTWKSCYGMAMNYYGYGRMATDKNVTVSQVLREYATFLATPETADALTEILIYIENNTEFERAQPAKYRLDPLPCSIISANQAKKQLESVVQLESCNFPLMEPIADIFGRIRARLDDLIADGV